MSTTTSSTTTTYILTTYRYQQDKPGVVRPTIPKDEWKIYQSNVPSSLHLILEITKTASGSYTAVVMKIVDTDETRPGGPTTLETIDFLDFSGPEASKVPSPLKAVLGGKQVGFRYLHPLKSDASSHYYKRIQLTMASPEDASALVTSIRHVCPTSNSQQAGSINATRAPISTQGIQPHLPESTNSIRVSVMNASQTITSPVDVQTNESLRGTAVSSEHRIFDSSPSTSRVDAPPSPSRIPPDPKPTQHSMLPPSQPNFSQNHQMHRALKNSRISPLPSPTLPTSPLTTIAPSAGPIFDSSSAPARPHQNLTPDPSIGTPGHLQSSQVQSYGAGNGEADIHKLSAHELETMVAQVVHEPGFTELMEKLDQMYALKGLIKS